MRCLVHPHVQHFAYSSLMRFSCHTVGGLFCLLFYSRLHSALMFFIRLRAMRFLQFCAGLGSFCLPRAILLLCLFNSFPHVTWDVLY